MREEESTTTIAENYVLFGRYTEDVNRKTVSQIAQEGLLQEVSEESGYIGAFAK